MATVHLELYHVYARQDKYLRYDQLDDEAEVNKLEGDLGDENLLESVANNP